MKDALAVSKQVPFIKPQMFSAIKKKCVELGASGFFVTFEKYSRSEYEDQVSVFHFVVQLSYEEFKYIREAINNLADIFAWSEVVDSFTLEISAGVAYWTKF